MDLSKAFIQGIRDLSLFPPSAHLLLAVSGGVDSVVLCELCHRAGFRFGIAHVNFQLRGAESEADEAFVRTLAAQYGVVVHVKIMDTKAYAAAKKVSIQVAARELRYGWFKELMGNGYQCLLTAHHADDNVETLLMNFFRGTGISGLRGMLPKKDEVVRPLLSFAKEQLLMFAESSKLVWREDSSNDTDQYSRNFFRHNIVPLVRSIYPGAERNLLDNIQRFRDVEILYTQALSGHLKKLVEKKGSEVHIPVLKLKQSIPLHTIVFEIIKLYGFTANQTGDVIQLLDADQGKLVRSPTHRIIRNRNWLIIADNQAVAGDFFIVEKGQEEAADGALLIRNLTGNHLVISQDKMIADLDARHIRFPLLFRKWKTGDYFYPLGMSKKKKVSRFLIDQKLSPTQKEKVMVLESDKKIIWVVGMRIDERFKVTPQTREIFECCVRKK